APLVVEPVPDRERDPEEPLPADAPVLVQTLDPRAIPRAHVRRVPRQLLAAAEQRLAEPEDRNEPLTARGDLQRTGAILVEIAGVSDRLRVAGEEPVLAKEADDRGPRPLHGRAREPLHRRVRRAGIPRLPSRRSEGPRSDRAVLFHDDAKGQVQ